MNQRTYLPCILLPCFLSAFSPTRADSAPIDTVLVRLSDVTGDAKPDSIILHIRAKTLHSPFKWHFTVRANGETIYSDRSDDSKLEDMFTEEFFPGCSYLQAKTKYYFQTFLGLELTREVHFGDPSTVLTKQPFATVFSWTKKYLVERCKLDKSKAEVIAERLRSQLLSKQVVILSHNYGIVDKSLPYVYIPEVGKMIPIFSD